MASNAQEELTILLSVKDELTGVFEKAGLNAEEMFGRLEKGINKTESMWSRWGRKSRAVLKKTGIAILKVTKKLAKMGSRLLGITSLLGGLAGGFLLLRAIRSVVTDAAAFRIKMAEISTILPDANVGVESLSRNLKDLSVALNVPLLDAATGLYQTLSSGFTDAAEATTILGQAARLGTAGLASTTDTINLLVTSLNAYRRGVEDVVEISDIMFETVRLGRTTITELSTSMGKALPLAASLGVKIQEVAAAMATMTQQGFNTEESATAVRALFKALLRQTGQLNLVFKKTGEQYTLQTARAKGLVETLRILRTSVTDDSEAMEVLGGRVEAANALFALTGQSLATFISILRKLESSAGATERALGKIIEEDAVLLQRALKAVNVEALAMGDAIIEGMADAIREFGGVNQIQADIRRSAEAIAPLAKTIAKTLIEWALSLGDITTLWDRVLIRAQILIIDIKQASSGLRNFLEIFEGGATSPLEGENKALIEFIVKADEATAGAATFEAAMGGFTSGRHVPLTQTLQIPELIRDLDSTVSWAAKLFDELDRLTQDTSRGSIISTANIKSTLDFAGFKTRADLVSLAAKAGRTYAEGLGLGIDENLVVAREALVRQLGDLQAPTRGDEGPAKPPSFKIHSLDRDTIGRFDELAAKAVDDLKSAFLNPNLFDAAGMSEVLDNFENAFANLDLAEAFEKALTDAGSSSGPILEAQRAELKTILNDQLEAQRAAAVIRGNDIERAAAELQLEGQLVGVRRQLAQSAGASVALEEEAFRLSVQKLGTTKATDRLQADQIIVLTEELRLLRDQNIERIRANAKLNAYKLLLDQANLLVAVGSQAQVGTEAALEAQAFLQDKLYFLELRRQGVNIVTAAIMTDMARAAKDLAIEQSKESALLDVRKQILVIQIENEDVLGRRKVLEEELLQLIIDQKVAAAFDAGLRGQALIDFRKALELSGTELTTFEEQMKALGETAKKSFAQNMTNELLNFVEGTKSAKDAFKNFARSFLREVSKMIIQQLILNAIQGFSGGGVANTGAKIPVNESNSFGGGSVKQLAKGGMGSFSELQKLPTKFYAKGGNILRSPHIAVMGEGKKNEAIVPLPDNRSIPVTLTGGGGGGATTIVYEVNVNAPIQAIDTVDFNQRIGGAYKEIALAVQQQLINNIPLRSAMKRSGAR